MLNDSPALARRPAAYVIASLCVLTALLQLVAALLMLNGAEGGVLLSTSDSAIRFWLGVPVALLGFWLVRKLRA